MLSHLGPALRAARYHLKSNIPNMSSSHASECLAASFGYGSYAAFLATIAGPTDLDDIPDDPDVRAFCDRAKAMGCSVLPDLAISVLKDALTELRPQVMGINEFLGVLNDAVVDGSARRKIGQTSCIGSEKINATRGKGFFPRPPVTDGSMSSCHPAHCYLTFEFDGKVSNDFLEITPYVDMEPHLFFESMLKLVVDDGESILFKGNDIRITPDIVRLPSDVAYLRGSYSYRFDRGDRGWKHTAAFKAVYLDRPGDGSRG